VIPCHRVISSDGSLGGFGGGVEIKELLLRLEAATSTCQTIIN
jgi:O-6-methylguanine DNA methyltransferase